MTNAVKLSIQELTKEFDIPETTMTKELMGKHLKTIVEYLNDLEGKFTKYRKTLDLLRDKSVNIHDDIEICRDYDSYLFYNIGVKEDMLLTKSEWERLRKWVKGK